MTRDILTLRNGENIVIELLSQEKYRVMGNGANIRYAGPMADGIVHSVSFPNGPRYSRGYKSNFRGEDRKVRYITVENSMGKNDSNFASILLHF